MENQIHMPVVTGYEIFRWPEFQALLRRMGVDDITDNTKNMSIIINVPGPDDLVDVTLNHKIVDKKGAIDTTNMHNDQWRTYIPSHSSQE